MYERLTQRRDELKYSRPASSAFLPDRHEKGDIIHLRCLVAAAEHRSFRRAAAALNVAQPTLSKRVRELEDRLGVPLFARSTGGAQLTPIGEEIVVSAKRVLAELATMEVRAKAGRNGNAGRLAIGYYTSLSSGALRETLLAFVTQHPGVEVNLAENSRASLISMLDRGAIDIIIVLGEPRYSEFNQKGLWSERIMAVLPIGHALATREYVYWTDLKNERFLMNLRDPGPEVQDILTHNLTSPGDRPIIKQLNVNRESVFNAVSAARGITLTCESIGNVMPGITYREVRDGNGPTRVGYVAYWRRDNDNPALKQMLTSLKAYPLVPAASSGATD